MTCDMTRSASPRISARGRPTPRDGEPADLERIRAIWNAEISSTTATWTTTPKRAADIDRWFAEKRADRIPVIVVGRPADGFATWGPFRRGEGYDGVAEHSVYVDAAARGRGIGGALLAALISRARAAGLSHLVGGIDAAQEASLALHRRHGFVEVGRLPGIGRKFGTPRTLVLMQRGLAEEQS